MGMPQGYASWGARVGAFLIDCLIAGLVPMILYFIAIGMSAERGLVLHPGHLQLPAR